MTNDQKIAECLAILGSGVALDPRDRATFDAHVNDMCKKPEKTKAAKTEKSE